MLFLCAQMIPKIVAHVLMSSVQFQQVQVERFKEHLLAREALQKELERAERERQKAQEDKQRAASPSSASKRQGRTMMFSKGVDELVSAEVFHSRLCAVPVF